MGNDELAKILGMTSKRGGVEMRFAKVISGSPLTVQLGRSAAAAVDFCGASSGDVVLILSSDGVNVAVAKKRV